MKSAVVAFALCALIFAPTVAGSDICLACVAVVGLVGEWFMPNATTADYASSLSDRASICQDNEVCNAFLDVHGSAMAASLSAGESPDIFCQQILLCPQNNSCILFKNWPVTPQGPWPSPKPFPSTIPEAQPIAEDAIPAEEQDPVMLTKLRLRKLTTLLAYLEQASSMSLEVGGHPLGIYGLAKSVLRVALTGRLDSAAKLGQKLQDPCGFNLTCLIDRVFDHHLPLNDNDGDNFGGSGTDIFSDGFRGANWRGRDCNDSDATIYPGRAQTQYGPEIDHNCNGIYGVDSTGTPYEEKFCSGSKQRGLVILGDSAAAHFHIPPSWVSGRDWNLDDLLPAAADELDWPQCSWSTGFQNTSACPPAALPMNSFAQRLRARNLCNHRDFQNIGVNGGRTTSMQPPGIITSFQRSQKVDQPALVFFALIGNDVCNGHPGTGSMTTPTEFYNAVTASLQYLDTVLPAGSFVLFIGLVDGRVLWNTMHDKIHPIGVPYPDLYEWLSCSGSNPCWGWLNSNETWRNTTTQHAQALNQVYANIVASQKYNNFQLEFHDPNWVDYINNYVSAGGLAVDLIEPVDGFHPSQTGNMYMASTVWEFLEQNYPDALGPINPNNAAIVAQFGDQGLVTIGVSAVPLKTHQQTLVMSNPHATIECPKHDTDFVGIHPLQTIAE